MTTPPELPDEPNPFEPPAPASGSIQPPPPPPPPMTSPTLRYSEGDPRRYNVRQVWVTALSIMAAIAVVSWFLPPLGLLVPLIFFVSLFFLLKQDPSVSYRSGLAGVLLGFGLGMLVTAGVCSVSLNNMFAGSGL